VRKRIPHFFSRAAPMRALIKSGMKFVWDKSQKITFNYLNEKIREAPVLGRPNLQ
jgi:hypothetical protein